MKRSDLALAALASAAVPGMKPVAVAGVRPTTDESPDVQEAVVEDATGRRWLVRSPLDPVAGARLQRNDELVRQLARHLPFKAPSATGYASVGKDGVAAVYPHVEGHPLDLSALPGGTGVATALGRAIAAVHNIPRAVFEEQDVPVFDAAGCRQRAITELDRAAETGRVPTALLARWEEAFQAAPLWQFATVPVHGGIRSGVVLVAFADEEDAATGRVVALSRWEDAMVGDPATDLARLFAVAPADGWEAVVESYALARAQRPDPYLAARARLLSETRHVRGLAQDVAEGREDDVRRTVELLRRMDRLTEDTSLVPVTARRGGGAPIPSTGGAPSEEDAPQVAEDGAVQVGWPEPDDVTAEVPLPEDVRVSPSSELAERSPVQADPAGRGPVTDPHAARTEHPGWDEEGPSDVVGANSHEPSPAAQDEVSDLLQSDELHPEDRLSELYGMPSEDDGEPGPRR